jgi:hypothetical protein
MCNQPKYPLERNETDELWVTAGGQEIPVGEMTENYAKNALRSVLRTLRMRRKNEANNRQHPMFKDIKPASSSKPGVAEFYRYVRPIDKKTGYADSTKGTCFYIVMDYDTRKLKVAISVCNGENFSKEIAKEITRERIHQGEFYVFSLDEFTNSGLALVEFIRKELKRDFPIIGAAALKQISESRKGK